MTGSLSAETIQGIPVGNFIQLSGGNAVIPSGNGLTVNGTAVISPSGNWVGPNAGLVGPTGSSGAPGATGATGSTGPAGATGASPWTLNGSDAYYSAGKVGVGTSAPAYTLDVAGGDVNIGSIYSLRISGTMICTISGCTASSDRRLKKNIEPLENSLDQILKLQGVSYNWKDKTKYGPEQQIGLIAQDLEKVFPQVVVTDSKTGLKSVAYGHLVAPLIESVKTLNTKLKEQNAQLMQENAAIKTYLCGKDPEAPFCKTSAK